MEDKKYIELSHVRKEYAVNQLKHIKNKDSGTDDVFVALNDINLRIEEGERVGIIGLNGAGKSTMLHLISGYSEADRGEISINGRVNAILEVGTNLSGELTGRENIYLAGEMYGLPKSRVDELMPEIVEFVDIGKYFEYPVKTYSSGMKARTAFAQISFIEPEILIIDEVLGVGDASFVARSTKLINDLCNHGKILLVVSHSMATINQLTKRCIWLDHGEIKMDDETPKVTEAYIRYIRELEAREYSRQAERSMAQNARNRSLHFQEFVFKSGERAENVFETGEPYSLHVVFQALRELQQVDIIVRMENRLGLLFFQRKLSEDKGVIERMQQNETLEVAIDFESCKMTDDTYTFICQIYEQDRLIGEQSQTMKVLDNKQEYYAKPLLMADSCWDVGHEGRKLKNEHYWSNSF